MRRLITVTDKWFKTRWILPLLFIIGYMATYSKLDGFELEYLVWTLLCITACCILLNRLGPPFHSKLPIWIFFPIFIVGYYIKFYLITFDPEILGYELIIFDIYNLAKEPAAILKWFTIISYAFITYCLTSWYLIGKRKYSNDIVPKGEINYNAVMADLVKLITSLLIITSYFMYRYGIARMSADNVYLPFRLAGWIYSFHVTLIPALLLLLIWCSDVKNSKIFYAIGLMLFILNGVISMLLRSSRGFFLYSFMMLMVLFLATGRINGKRVKMFASILLITIILLPYVSFYRTIRAESISIPISSLLAEVVENTTSAESEPFLESLKAGSIFMLTRFNGADSLLRVLGSDYPPLYETAFTGPISVTRHYTINIVGFSEEAIHSEAPSALGWFYIVGGTGMVLFGTLFSIAFVWICWCSLAKLKLLCLPVAQALFLTWFIMIFIDGTLDAPFVPLLVIGGSIIVCEIILRSNRSISVLQNMTRN